jgi:phage-related holin
MSRGINEIKKIISHVIKELKSKNTFFGKLQVMKLMFLIEHLDIQTDKLTKKGCLGNEFIIYYLGPFSFEVSEAYDTLSLEEIEKLSKEELPPEIKRRINYIIEKYGNKNGIELQEICMNKLGISPIEKSRYFGVSVREILK